MDMGMWLLKLLKAVAGKFAFALPALNVITK